MDSFKVSNISEQPSQESSLCYMGLAEWASMDKTALSKQFPIFAVDHDRPIESIIRPPNADDSNPDSVLEVANGGTKCLNSVRSAPWGWLVSVGEIMLLQDSGQTLVVGPGRWVIKYHHRCFVTWGRRYQITCDKITDGTFSFVRVRRGQLGLAVENGKPVLLQEGLHVYNNPLFSFKEFKSVDAVHVNHMSYHVVRVPRGSFGMITEQARAKLLPEGMHTVDNAVFDYKGMANTIDSYINHGTIHIIQVPKGSLGLVRESNAPLLLQEGVHIYDSPTLKFEGFKSMLSSQILHGTISRFQVLKGQVGLAWFENEPMLIESPGTYQVDSPNFAFVSLVNAAEKTIALGAKKIITVNAGEVGVTFKAGTLTILQPGRHYIEATDHVFDDFLSTQQLSLRLNPLGDDSDELLLCETKDLVNIGIRADVFYRIADPEQALMQVGRTFIPELVRETSIATLNNITRSTALGEIAQNEAPSAQSEKEHKEKLMSAQALGDSSAPLFFDKAHDLFLAKLHDDFMERYGLEITNIRIEQFKIMNDSLSDSISGQAVKTAATQNELANLEGQTKIATQQKERDTRLQQIQVEGEARALQTKASSEKAQAEALAAAQQVRNDMDANTKRIQAQAEADAIRLKAQAQADAMKIQAEATVSQAKAEAEAITLKAKAEAGRAEMLGSTPLGEKLSLLEIYGDMVKKSNEGVEKVVYVDPTTMQAGNPLGMLTLQSLQTDLSRLNPLAK